MALNPLTTAAFDRYRAGAVLKAVHPDAPRYAGDSDQLTASEGLEEWQDGAVSGTAPKGHMPTVPANPENSRLWVVTSKEVFHALEVCPFGAAREAKRLKHSNLTGGANAFAGGELVFIDGQTIVINGCSGRYRVASEAEMKALASAFRASGYRVWNMGYNTDINRPALFGTQDPEWVA